jgi:hypothetical protein
VASGAKGPTSVSQSLKRILLILQITGSRDLIAISLRNIQNLPSGSEGNKTDAAIGSSTAARTNENACPDGLTNRIDSLKLKERQ